MTLAHMKSKWIYAVVLAVAVGVIGAGLSRFGIWQPAELHMADLARDDSLAREASGRPPAQVALLRMGFRSLGATESGGRLPTAVLAILATLALAFAVGSATDPRTGGYVGIAYATMPLVYLNARQMFGGGVAQSGATLLFAAAIYVFWGRPPPNVRDERGYGGTDAVGGSEATSGAGTPDAAASPWPARWASARWLILGACAVSAVALLIVGMRVGYGTSRASWLPGATIGTAVLALLVLAYWSPSIVRDDDAEPAEPPGDAPGKRLPFREGAGPAVTRDVEILREPDPPEHENAGVAAAWRYGRWALLGVGAVAALGAGWMLGVLPVVLGVAIAALLRWRIERGPTRVAAVLLAITGVALTIVCVRAAMTAHETYNAWTGASPDARAPAQFPTYEAFIEQIGHGTFPWTGILVFGIVRLLVPPPSLDANVGRIGIIVDAGAAVRESGVRLAAFTTAGVAFGLQSFHLQQFGLTPFIGVASLAVAIGVALRDAEREARPWRLITAVATFITIVMMRDYLLFPKQSYAALGLADGGPSFPTGFTSTLKDWFKSQGSRWFVSFLHGNATGEVFFLFEALLFIFIALSALFQGAGDAAHIPWARPYRWMKDTETYAQAQFDAESEGSPAWARVLRKWFSGFGILSGFRIRMAALAVVAMLYFGITAQTSRTLTTPIRMIYRAIAALPVAIIVGIYAILALWNLFAWLGRPKSTLMRAMGTRVAFVPLAALCVALMATQMFIPALSEHLSPRGVWAVIRRERRGVEPVARFGGNQNDRATRYYANFEVRDLFSEPEAVEWLTQRSPRHFMVVGADVFPSLNRAYRATMPQGSRRNIPVIDATNSNLYVAASDAGDRGSRNPLESLVLTRDRDDRDTPGLRYHPHGRNDGNTFVREAAVFDNAIEYLGFNLDSGGQSYVAVGGTFTITYHFHVIREVYGSHQIFVHVDGTCPRINGDHEPLGGRYPVRFWMNGDYIHDQHRITIPGYCRAGRYSVNIGFFQGDDRMRVTGGDHDRENRVVAARIVVR